MKQALKEKPIYRYKIKELLAKQTPAQASVIRKKVLKDAGISKSSWSRFLNLPYETSQADIPSSVLAVFANHLHVRMEDLFN